MGTGWSGIGGISKERKRRRCLCMANYSPGCNWKFKQPTAMALVKPTEGCIPEDEIDEDPVAELRRCIKRQSDWPKPG